MILTFLLLAQVTPMQPMPRGTGLPPVVVADEAPVVLATVQRFLSALEANDRAAILAVTRAEGGATAALERPDGATAIRHLGWAEFAAQFTPGRDHFSEGITDPAVEVDGSIAMVWAPYTVKRNGTLSHCGYDHFDLVREAGAWKVLNVTWSQRTTGCDAR